MNKPVAFLEYVSAEAGCLKRKDTGFSTMGKIHWPGFLAGTSMVLLIPSGSSDSLWQHIGPVSLAHLCCPSAPGAQGAQKGLGLVGAEGLCDPQTFLLDEHPAWAFLLLILDFSCQKHTHTMGGGVQWAVTLTQWWNSLCNKDSSCAILIMPTDVRNLQLSARLERDS